MEVHHHSHAHGKKNWKAYFWEFLMLFLAVFCGFLAEYQLEHKIEKDREKQYMQSMLKDLEKDTVSINTAIANNTKVLKGLDTLLNIIESAENGKMDQKNLFLYSVKYTYWYFTVEFSELTLSQLKNGGGYRLIKNNKVAAGIADYAQGLEFCKYEFAEFTQYYHRYEETQKKIINWSLAKQAYAWLNKDIMNMLRPMEEMEKLVPAGNYILPEASRYLPQYYTELLFYSSTMLNLHTYFEKQKQKAISLSQLIRESYKLKN
jgi:hypothetical protein